MAIYVSHLSLSLFILLLPFVTPLVLLYLIFLILALSYYSIKYITLLLSYQHLNHIYPHSFILGFISTWISHLQLDINLTKWNAQGGT